MKKLLKFYQRLTPQTRFWLIFFALASFIWVPVRMNTGVEVYEPYRYDIDDVEENQVVFAYQLRDLYAEYDRIGVICKDGTGKVIYLETANLSDEELLDVMDSCMTDEKWENCEKKVSVDKKILNYCINISDIELKFSRVVALDANTEIFYVVAGTGENRHLKRMRKEGMEVYSNSDLWVNLLCDEIKRVCR